MLGEVGPAVASGQGIEVAGALTALIAGVIETSSASGSKEMADE